MALSSPPEAQPLDALALAVVLAVIVFTTALILVPLLWGHLRCARLQAEARRSSAAPLFLRTHTTPLRVLLGCGAMVLLMLATSSSVVAALLAGFGPQRRPGHRFIGGVPASINFCEEDFVHSSLVAEPANAISSLISYPLFAWLSATAPAPGLRGPPRRFVAGALALLAIGVGSCALHSLLIASAQAGDELPMFWYVAIAAFITLDAVLDAAAGSTVAGFAHNGRRWLPCGFGGAAFLASGVYVAVREYFTVFFAGFSLFAIIIIAGITWLNLGISWGALRGPAGSVAVAGVIMPLTAGLGWCTVLAMWCWVAEMHLCEAALQSGGQTGGVLLAMLFNRVLHPLWHTLSALVAYLVLQVLLAVHGLLRHEEWGPPACCGLVPRVTFAPRDKVG